MQDDNELHAQSILTVAAFTEWANKNNSDAINLGIENISIDTLFTCLSEYLKLNGFSHHTKLIDGNYMEFLIL